jgi:hypothetical protein
LTGHPFHEACQVIDALTVGLIHAGAASSIRKSPPQLAPPIYKSVPLGEIGTQDVVQGAKAPSIAPAFDELREGHIEGCEIVDHAASPLRFR